MPQETHPCQSNFPQSRPSVPIHFSAFLTFDERNWKQFHNPKDLAISLSLEAAELLECFQWSGEDTEVAGKTAAMKEELSDVVIYALLLADRLGLDLDAAVREKIQINAAKYPVKESYGNSAKYDKLKQIARSS